MKLIQRIENKKRLDNFLSYVSQLIKEGKLSSKTYFDLIKIYSDTLNLNNNIDLLSDSNYFNIDEFEIFLSAYENEVKIDKSFNVYLGKDAVLSCIWDKRRIVDNINDIGTDKNTWKKDDLNHFYKLYLPIGITLVYNGNHSVNCGIIKSFCSLDFSPERANIVDISSIYDDFFFDGYHLRSRNPYIEENKLKIPFELGCILELGRLLKENNISYLSTKYK